MDSNGLGSISVSPVNSSLHLGRTQQFMAIGNFGDGSSRDISSSVNWKSSSTNVAVINSSGLATANATGTTTIATSKGDIDRSAILTVSVNNSGFSVSPSSQTISLGQTLQFTATINGSSVSGVSWTSSRTNIETIDQNGVATGNTGRSRSITPLIPKHDCSAIPEIDNFSAW